tara:strand:+ start:113 stop:691 length:579 start_codon:yes stop_codon:yes gene_type:complete
MINNIYERNFDKLPPANKQLVGKIQNEHSLYYQGKDLTKMHHHNVLPRDVLQWLRSKFIHYLEFTQTSNYTLDINSVWVNTMKAHEYNPVHVHQGTRYTGLSSVMFLKLPKDMGPEYSSTHIPMNGRLQILGSVAGQFVKSDYSPQMSEGDFYIFPYDMRHCVYPMTNPQATRRTLSCNVDVNYNPIASRVA